MLLFPSLLFFTLPAQTIILSLSRITWEHPLDRAEAFVPSNCIKTQNREPFKRGKECEFNQWAHFACCLRCESWVIVWSLVLTSASGNSCSVLFVYHGRRVMRHLYLHFISLSHLHQMSQTDFSANEKPSKLVTSFCFLPFAIWALFHSFRTAKWRRV